MSDGFDKEAEREKLREKFAEDEKKREHTQRMSELLLQGATMTNRHCETCGDPIFRHDGREFCPTCHATDDGYEVPAGDETGADEDGSAAAADQTTAPETARNRPGPAAAANGDAGVDATAGTDPAVENDVIASNDAGPNATEPAGVGGEHDASEEAVGRSPSSTPPTTAASPNSAGEAAPDRDAVGGDATGGIAAARESLTRTLTRFARAAEETDDPRRARDHLRAAREAAEALAALD
ncbi:Sjogren's syndrome/scleroderma autoantigen 1 (Autoantigen p27) [Halorubrum aquaticum]|uniref:Sjogren's syndrome/scleroderma autoantigen 1 (Autoantigen p27) n=1 Tax=Halorubrum aquaticum TaxID=387340 RepID=A0A1I3AUI7_9EURY|nr:Sjogren's syndrome/scleroderma autoantigen 1 family protein [Halorubrum aquaticum]SFH53011.1 Sjogren's syndrome/scleroderma autoantigen 1 (Autoantigen p27) [Halorubrum aquaticum]